MNTKQILSGIKDIASTPFSKSMGINAISFNVNNFNHNWVVNGLKTFPSDYTVQLDNINQAVEIIHEFSNNPKNGILKGLKSISTYTEEPPFYLHYFKTLTNLNS